MSTLAVIAYPDQSTAGEAAAALQRMQKEFLIELEDVAWVTKAQDGKMKLHQGTSLTGAGAAVARCGASSSACSSWSPLRGWPSARHPAPSPDTSAITASTTSGSRRWLGPSNRAARRSL